MKRRSKAVRHSRDTRSTARTATQAVVRGRRGGLLLIGLAVLAGTLALILGGPWWDREAATSARTAREDRRPTQATKATQPPAKPQPPAKLPENSAPSFSAAAGPSPPTPAPAVSIEDLKKEEIEVVQRLMRDFPNKTDPLALLGNVLNRHGNTAEAVRCWEDCLRRNPRRADAYDGLALVALRKGETEKAVALWRQALAADPAMTKVYPRLGRALIDLGQLQEAAVLLEKGIVLSPREGECHYLLGQVHLQSGRYAEAKKSHETAIQVQPDHSGAYYGLATACARLGEADKSRQSLAEFRRLRSKEREVQDFREAGYDLRSARQGLAQTYTGAGRVYRGNGFLLAAEQCCRKAAALDPRNTACRLELASLHLVSGEDLGEAKALVQQVVEMSPSAAYFFFLGQVCEKSGDRNGAIAAFQRAAQLDPANADYRQARQRAQKKD